MAKLVGELDPITFEVVLHRLLDITEEMGIKYMRTSGSPILVGAYDASTGITLPNGELVAIGPYITTQANVLPVIIQSVRTRCITNPGISAGDMFICNDPYLGATHQPDVATVAPAFRHGELVAWVGSSGHWLDIGGPEPGGFNMKAYTAYDEGLRMPPTRIVEQGRIREDLVGLIMNQVRDPLCELDLRGQIVANMSGLQRMDDLFDQYGLTTVRAVMHEAINHVERRLRARLKELPDGVWQEVQFLDHDGHLPTMHKIVCTITKRRDVLRVDFTGSSPQADGFINCTLSGVRAATLSAMYILLAYDLPWNDGVARCLDLVAPPGTVVTAQYPAPISMATIASIILSLNVVFSALSKMLLASPRHYEEAMANWCGTSIAPTISGLNDRGIATVFGETSHFGAGCGARTYRDGVNTGGIIINTTASIPSIESSEAEYPLLYLFRRQLIDSGGPGKFRGGVSAGVAVIPHDAGGQLESSFAACGLETPNAYGLAGGFPGAAVRYIRFAETTVQEKLRGGTELPSDLAEIDGQRQITHTNQSHATLPFNMVEYHNWQGGGGYGDPLDRDAARVRQDVADQLVSSEAAAALYGVVLKNGQVDEPATVVRREELRRGRLVGSRPATEVLLDDPHRVASQWIDMAEGGGILSYGNAVQFDFDKDEAVCLSCGRVLGAARADFRRGCAVQETPVTAAGPVRGEDYDLGRIRLRLYLCPGCGRQLEVEVALVGSSGSGFRLAPVLGGSA
jgi:N-methylhydantoinase B